MGIRLQAAAATLQGSLRVASKSVAEASSKSVAETSSAGSKRVRRIPSRVVAGSDDEHEHERKRAEEALRTIMYLSCWWPN